jgi:uncharacterized membrane protein YdjX (TVP38/TMEM64 family)
MKHVFIRLIPLLPFIVLALAAVVATVHVRYYW